MKKEKIILKTGDRPLSLQVSDLQKNSLDEEIIKANAEAMTKGLAFVTSDHYIEANGEDLGYNESILHEKDGLDPDFSEVGVQNDRSRCTQNSFSNYLSTPISFNKLKNISTNRGNVLNMKENLYFSAILEEKEEKKSGDHKDAGAYNLSELTRLNFIPSLDSHSNLGSLISILDLTLTKQGAQADWSYIKKCALKAKPNATWGKKPDIEGSSVDLKTDVLSKGSSIDIKSELLSDANQIILREDNISRITDIVCDKIANPTERDGVFIELNNNLPLTQTGIVFYKQSSSANNSWACRNNNPGNIKVVKSRGVTYVGEIPREYIVNSIERNKFAVFINPFYGIMAMIYMIMSIFRYRGQKTVQHIVLGNPVGTYSYIGYTQEPGLTLDAANNYCRAIGYEVPNFSKTDDLSTYSLNQLERILTNWINQEDRRVRGWVTAYDEKGKSISSWVKDEQIVTPELINFALRCVPAYYSLWFDSKYGRDNTKFAFVNEAFRDVNEVAVI